MSNLCITESENTPVFERKYWNFRNLFPRDKPEYINSRRIRFKLHREEWEYSFILLEARLHILIVCRTNSYPYKFYKVVVGIFGESGEMVGVSRATGWRCCLEVENLIQRSQFDSIQQSDELFTLFIEVEKKDRKWKMCIFGESVEVIGVSIATQRLQCSLKVENLIQRSQFDSIQQSDELFTLLIEVEKKDHKSRMLKRKIQTDFRDLLLSGERSDMKICVKNKTFTCHRLILGTRSPVFSAMMNHEMKEKRSGEIIVTDVEPKIFEEFLLYIYTGNEEYLNWENVMELYKLGHMYEVRDLQHLCAERIKEGITVENFYEWLLFSQLHHDLELSGFISNLFVENSENITKSESWIEFQKEHPNETDVLVKAMDKRRMLLEQRVSPPVTLEVDDFNWDVFLGIDRQTFQ